MEKLNPFDVFPVYNIIDHDSTNDFVHIKRKDDKNIDNTSKNLFKTRKRNPNRRSKKDKKKTIDLKILHTNMDGYISKRESLSIIVKKMLPDIISINETALKGNRKVNMSGYIAHCRNRENNKGGVATLINESFKSYTLLVK